MVLCSSISSSSLVLVLFSMHGFPRIKAHLRPDTRFKCMLLSLHSFSVVSFFYPSSFSFCFAMVMFHFLKRELETAFVHRFSMATMPFSNLPRNCAHYWLGSGLFVAYFTYHPLYTPPPWSNTVVLVLVLGWAVCAGRKTTHAVPSLFHFSSPSARSLLSLLKGREKQEESSKVQNEYRKGRKMLKGKRTNDRFRHRNESQKIKRKKKTNHMELVSFVFSSCAAC